MQTYLLWEALKGGMDLLNSGITSGDLKIVQSVSYAIRLSLRTLQNATLKKLS